MKVSGFTIIRNGVYYAYPFREAILSVLPLCDEFIVNVGNSDDDTLKIIKELAVENPKLSYFESEWDMDLKDGKVLSVETNRALQKCSGDWCFYIQSDEVLHEKYYGVVEASMKKYSDDKDVEGLRFWYQHFYGSYDYVQDNYRKWYIREVRIIKRSDNIVSWGDAMDFRHRDGTKINYRDIKAEIYHYGWVRPPETLIKKRSDFELLYNKGKEAEKNISHFQNYDDLGNLKKFEGTHPAVMSERISISKWNFDAKLDEQKPEWLRKFLILMDPVIKRIKQR